MRTARLDIARAQRRRGFTLVEMLIVVGIIVILVTMLTPSLAAVRTAARVTSTRVLLYTLETGLNMFKGEIPLGRDYPPSYAERPVAVQVPYPYSSGQQYLGAQTLHWALAGPKLGGTPGFTYDPASNIYFPSFVGAPREYGPFVDVGKIKIGTPPQPGDPEEWAWAAPIFPDDFGKPVLYYKATPNSVAMQIYDPSHNSYIVWGHPLSNPNTFWNYIADPRTNNTYPHNRDGFLIISAGPDKRYGTPDDVANFPFNPQQ
jgi:prepilin-type N-terminal cleavage/methylation domain-containing protein